MNIFDYNVYGKCIKTCIRFADDDAGGEGGSGGGGGFDVGTVVGDGGSLNTDGIRTSLGEGYEDFKGFDDYKDLPSLLKGAADTKRAFHAKTEGMVKLPGEDASAEEITAYRQAIGVPESADKYEFERRKLEEGKEFDAEGTEMFKGAFLDANLNQSQAQKLVAAFDKYEEGIVTKMAEMQVADAKAANEAFDQKHGQDAEKVRRLAGEAITKLEFNPVIEVLEKTYPGIGNDPAILDWIHGKVIPKMLPGQFKLGDSPETPAPKTGLRGVYNHKTSAELTGV